LTDALAVLDDVDVTHVVGVGVTVGVGVSVGVTVSVGVGVGVSVAVTVVVSVGVGVSVAVAVGVSSSSLSSLLVVVVVEVEVDVSVADVVVGVGVGVSVGVGVLLTVVGVGVLLVEVGVGVGVGVVVFAVEGVYGDVGALFEAVVAVGVTTVGVPVCVGVAVSMITILAEELLLDVGEMLATPPFFAVLGDAYVALSLATINSPVAIKISARNILGRKLGRVADWRNICEIRLRRVGDPNLCIMHENSYPILRIQNNCYRSRTCEGDPLSKVYHLSCNPPTFLPYISPFLLINVLLRVKSSNKNITEKAVLGEYRV